MGLPGQLPVHQLLSLHGHRGWHWRPMQGKPPIRVRPPTKLSSPVLKGALIEKTVLRRPVGADLFERLFDNNARARVAQCQHQAVKVARLWRRRLLFAENECSLKKHTRELFSGANVTSYLARARPLKRHLEFIVASENRVSLGMLFRRYGRSEAISVNRASATVGRDAVATPDFPVRDMRDAGALAAGS
jgi:hypothetical protein